MRRGSLILTFALTMVVAAVLTMAGCGPSGADGKITDYWPAMAEPTGWEPVVGVCYEDVAILLRRSQTASRDCSQQHRAEIVHVGRIADDAALVIQPVPESPAYLKAWAECDAKTTEYLGGPWRDRKIRISVAFPGDQTWASGARWFACQASVLQRVVGSRIYVGFGVKGGFDAKPELAYGCAQVSDKQGGDDWTAKLCDEAHNAEFAGTFIWATSYETAKAEVHRENSAVHRKCREVVGSFAGATVRTGTYVWIPSEEDWKAGDNGVRCFYWLSNQTVNRSLKGVGRSGWPLT